MSIIDAYIEAEKECTESVDINPGKVLRPIGTTFRVWNECLCSTEPPHWTTYKVVKHGTSFVARNGKKMLFERTEEIEAV